MGVLLFFDIENKTIVENMFVANYLIIETQILSVIIKFIFVVSFLRKNIYFCSPFLRGPETV